MPVAFSLILVVMASGLQSGGPLIRESVRGLNRLCYYQDLAQSRRAPALLVQIGMAEPCPFQYPGPERPRPQNIPSLAQLKMQTRANGETTCTYEYMGVRYSRTLGAVANCPLTPHFGE
ncbi:MAG: hypothetical protein E6G92_14530 [Alphaproteobacteria bacterium]|nr:MAG: hypothetical protein E6G92_14530 [Alphaproteobacteria bacterium]